MFKLLLIYMDKFILNYYLINNHIIITNQHHLNIYLNNSKFYKKISCFNHKLKSSPLFNKIFHEKTKPYYLT